MSKIPVRVKVKRGLKNSMTKKRFDLDSNGRMLAMQNHFFDVKLWDKKNNSVLLPNGLFTFTFDIGDVVDMNTDIESLPPLPKPEIFNPNKLDI